MDHFQYRNNTLYAEEVDLQKITKKIKTPFYCYSHKTLLRHFYQIKDAFQVMKPLICFAVKTNANHTLLKTLVKEGCGFDIVSGYELKQVLKAGADPKKIVYAGVGKTAMEIEWALKAGIYMFNCESTSEIELINSLSKLKNKITDIAVRINPDIIPKTHKHITTGRKETKFGISIYEIDKVIQTLKKCPNINLCGIHFHIGSQIINVTPYVETIKKILKLIEYLKSKNHNITHLNIGGGLGIIYHKEKPTTPEQFAKRILPLIQDQNLQLIMEPGRYISGNSGILITRVTYIKKSLNRTFVIVDAGMNTLIRPALYEAWHEVAPLQKRKNTMKADIVGPICETTDMFAKERIIPQIKEGEYIAFKSAGAYGRVMASNYNGYPFPAEVLVKGKKFKKI